MSSTRGYASAAAINLSTNSNTTASLNNNSNNVNNNNNSAATTKSAAPAAALADQKPTTATTMGSMPLKFANIGHHMASATSSALHSLQQLQQVHTGATAVATHLATAFGGGGGGGGSRADRGKSGKTIFKRMHGGAMSLYASCVFLFRSPSLCDQKELAEEQTCADDFHARTVGTARVRIRAATVYGRTGAFVFGTYIAADRGSGITNLTLYFYPTT